VSGDGADMVFGEALDMATAIVTARLAADREAFVIAIRDAEQDAFCVLAAFAVVAQGLLVALCDVVDRDTNPVDLWRHYMIAKNQGLDHG
jgi:hypothetical protein